MTHWIRRHAPTLSTDALVRVTALVSVLLVCLAAATVYLTAQGRWRDERAARSDELRACSASFSAELVTGPTARALKAAATYGFDSDEFRTAVAEADPGRFVALSRLARTDPGKFLSICRETAS